MPTHLRAFALLISFALPITATAADGIHWTFSGPTAVTVNWRGADSTLRFGPTTSYGSNATGRTPNPVPFSSPGPYWEARLEGLAPHAVYHYSVGDGPDHLFHTPPPAGASFTLYVEGDIGDSDTYPRVAEVQSLIAADAPAFVLVLGDLTYGDDNGLPAVDQHFNDVMVWSQDAAYMPTWGNHEWGSGSDDLRNYKGRFDLPNSQTSPGSPEVSCCGEDWYWFDYGGVRFIAYPEPYSGAWSDWHARADSLMDNTQADSTIRFIVTFGHRPAYSSGNHSGNNSLRELLDDLGSSHDKYVLNLCGHSHNYERTHPQSGVTHVTVGIGGSSLEQESGDCPWAGGCPAPPWSAFRALHHGALRLRVTPTSIQGDAICGPPGDSTSSRNDIACAPGDAFDSFTIGGESPGVVDTRLDLGRVTPNPVKSRFRVAVVLESAAPVRLELLGPAGRVVWSQPLDSPGPGPHEIELDRAPGWKPGIYWLRVVQSGRAAARKVVIAP